MPKAKSKAQMRFMAAVAAGRIKAPGFSMQEARDSLHKSKAKGLPERVKRKKK